MADIELVIKIPEEIYKDIIENGFIYDEDNEIVTDVIKNSIPFDNVLDKIRAEIKEKYEKYKYLFDTDFMGTKDLEWVLSVIDKYMKGSE